ncbi:DegV family EDD domain-containing protein [Streptococcus urinalis FB127-CNA-2]|uniref:EDD domain protein, DegV family n=1 Tax=Streptococcus urinalis 2285-97 TaxID=764291 RepID=G5KCD1_9STRE|nr:DegV family protein [Streptococcus urinalis]EHJ57513.1 hypothetical protein STRUR_0446 [Streptococcus urinalis 2285-97]EKS19760.1 DegV family EDD domain-containing protein [Streptococcus urinalis FB127-CNA-2]VEF31337.1 DegV family protein [Streptococcus urinalis]
MTWKIVVDSGCDLKALTQNVPHLHFERVPLTLQVGNSVYVDDYGLDIEDMMNSMYANDLPTKSSCPSPDAFLNAYRGYDKIIVITITSNLSGSYNSASLAKNLYLEERPDTQIHIIDSLSAGGEMDLLAMKLENLIAEGLIFEEVVEKIKAYQEKTKLIFVLAKVDNLVKNGRLSKLVGKVVGLLNIRMVGQASSEGTLELLQKARGQKKAVKATYEEMLKSGYKGGKVFIGNQKNEKICQQLEELIKPLFPNAEIIRQDLSGLCSFYAEKEGILMGYEI